MGLGQVNAPCGVTREDRNLARTTSPSRDSEIQAHIRVRIRVSELQLDHGGRWAGHTGPLVLAFVPTAGHLPVGVAFEDVSMAS